MSAMSCGCDPDYVGEQGYDQGVKGWKCNQHRMSRLSLMTDLDPNVIGLEWAKGVGRTLPITKPDQDTGVLRTFETGATRDTAQDKPDYEGFTSPLVTKRFGEYMMVHQKQSDGTLRTSDNWQKGIPFPVYVKSLVRHVEDLKLHHDGEGKAAVEQDIESVLAAIIFNANGALFEVLKGRR
jgi:hypothetical protein